jgi:hypothetical protein
VGERGFSESGVGDSNEQARARARQREKVREDAREMVRERESARPEAREGEGWSRLCPTHILYFGRSGLFVDNLTPNVNFLLLLAPNQTLLYKRRMRHDHGELAHGIT